jgi:hypothetical protein
LTPAASAGSPTIAVANDAATIRGMLTGTQGLIKSRTGSLTLAGNDTFCRFIAVSAGTLTLANPSAVGGAADRIKASFGAALDLDGQVIARIGSRFKTPASAEMDPLSFQARVAPTSREQ